MASRVEFWIVVLTMLASSTAILSNAVGIYLLKMICNRDSIQNFILIAISATDIGTGIGWLSENIAALLGYRRPHLAWAIIWSLRSGIYLVWYGMLFALTLDRFVGVNFPFRHRQMNLERNIRWTVICAWLFGCLNGIAYCILDTYRVYDIYNKYIWISLDALYLFTFTITYSSIFFKMFNARNQNVRGNQTLNQQRFVKITTMIFLTVIFLEVIPNIGNIIAIRTLDLEGYTLNNKLILLIYNFNLIADPLIYIFMQPRVRGLLYEQLGRLCTRKSRTYSFSRESICRIPRDISLARRVEGRINLGEEGY